MNAANESVEGEGIVSAERKTKAARALEAIGTVAGKIDHLSPCELLRVARSINPAMEDFQARLVVVEDFNWINEPALNGSCHVCYSGSECYMGRALYALVFFREMLRGEITKRTTSNVRLVYEFPRSEEDPRKIWLDVTTGLPWVPRSCEAHRQHLTEERRRELSKLEAGEFGKARAEVARIEAEKCYTLFWQIDNERTVLGRNVDVLQELVRPHSKAEWKVKREIAWKYFPEEQAA